MGLRDNWNNPLQNFQEFISPAYEDDEEQVDGRGLPGNNYYDS